MSSNKTQTTKENTENAFYEKGKRDALNEAIQWFEKHFMRYHDQTRQMIVSDLENLK